eukprot:GDKK01046845.1.p1 GENE.GDKK01046845.1~~GDKK01046845.1.p1  ORF type:complete len:299 (-),score=31.33 GDKK01046845.1:215-1111(-)
MGGNLGIDPFLNGTKELCTSLHPEEVVAEGLAIRGAVLSGVSGGKLRELLVMDCVNNAIGVMTWEDSAVGTGSTGSAGSAGGNDRVFNSILHKGLAIPASNTMRFPLEHAAQKFVSLDIFEEVEECRLKQDTSGSNRDFASDEYEMAYKYHVVATADIPIPAADGTDGAADGNGSGSVDISFTMTTDGMLKFNVVRVQTSTATASASGDVHNHSANLLIVYIALMLGLYLFVKIVLGEAEVTDVGGVSGVASSVASSASGAAASVVEAVSSVGSCVGSCVSDGVHNVCGAVGDAAFEL